MNRMQSGGGMPDMAELMQDETMRNMCVEALTQLLLRIFELIDVHRASQFMGGQGGNQGR